MTGYFGKTDDVKDKLTKALDQAGLAPSVRGEALGLEEFASLADALKGQGLLRCRDKSLKHWPVSTMWKVMVKVYQTRAWEFS